MNTNDIQYVLWLQSASPLAEDLLWINGEPPVSQDKKSETFSWMLSDWKSTASFEDNIRARWKSPRGWKKHKEEHLPQGISNNLTIMINGDFLLIQACVLDTDEQGRKRPYIYCSRFPESKRVTEILEKWDKCIDSAHANLNKRDKNCVECFLRDRAKNKKKRILSIAIVLLAILLITVTSIIYFNHPDCFYFLYEKFRQTTSTSCPL